ncbi:MAG TPA: HAD hydrolase family protein [Candidatus Deferrimicrobium sp.]|nr:HAD hydrolase family protein [Candidatus Deferrimicrobium sp.]
MKVCAFDMEGPLSFTDFAAEICKLLGPRLKYEKLDEFFQMISNYDDYLIDNPQIIRELKIPSYEPGDTLKLLAPIYVSFFTDAELIEISKKNIGLIPGSKDTINYLKKEWDISIISTSYTQHAYNVARELGIPLDHVYCTTLDIDSTRNIIEDIQDHLHVLIETIFEVYLKKGSDLEAVIEDLHQFFWKKDSDYVKAMNTIFVRGGHRKEAAVVEISEKLSVPISEMIATGDSITDKDMLRRLNEEGGIAISFNGNQYSIPHANVAVTSPNLMGVIAIFSNRNNVWDFLEKWEKIYSTFAENPNKIPGDLIDKKLRSYFIQHNFVPRLDNLKKATVKEKEKIIGYQKKMRKKVRGWFGALG